MIRKWLIVLFLLAGLGAASRAQAGPHSVSLSWTAAADATTATTYHIYRALGACSNGVVPTTLTSLSFVQLDGANSAISATNYTDSTVGVGAFCYYITASLNGSSSAPSLTAGALVPPLAPSTPVAIPH